MKPRVVVTGLGLVTPLGTGVEKTWQRLLAGESGIDRIQGMDPTNFKCQIAGQVKDFNAEDWLPKKKARRLDAFTHFAIAVARQAFEMAQLPDPLPPEMSPKAGCIIGVGLGGLQTLEATIDQVRGTGPNKVSPFFIPRLIGNMAPGEVAMELQLWGPNLCISTACAAGAHAIGEAMRSIQIGTTNLMVAGGTEAVITPVTLAGFASARALSTRNDQPQKASRPFDMERDGFVMAEGAGVLVLEELELAKKRGAPILAELVGYALTCDAYHMTAPEPGGRGYSSCMQLALDDAGLRPDQIDYINAHGTSTDLNDRVETEAIRQVFGPHAKKLPVSSTKSMLGHSLGATGAIEAAVSVLALRDQVIPPTMNYETPDPDCDLDYVPNKKREAKIDYVLSNSFGFGGTNATLIFGRYNP